MDNVFHFLKNTLLKKQIRFLSVLIVVQSVLLSIWISCSILKADEKNKSSLKDSPLPKYIRRHGSVIHTTGNFIRTSIYITAKDLQQISSIPGIKHLRLQFVTLDPEGLKYLANLKDLYLLELYGCNITDRDIPFIVQCKNIEYLSLADSRISEKGLNALGELKNLKSLGVNGCPFLSAGAKRRFMDQYNHIKCD